MADKFRGADTTYARLADPLLVPPDELLGKTARADALSRPIDPSGEPIEIATKYLAKPTFTALQWILDKFLTGEQVTAAAYRHYRQQQQGRDTALYPEQEFTGYGDAMKKGLTHKTEWDWTDVARSEDWFGKGFEAGRHLHRDIAGHKQTLANQQAHTPEQIERARKQLKASQDALDFGNIVAGFMVGIVADPLTYLGPGIVGRGLKAAGAPLKLLHKNVLVKIGGYSKLSTRLTEIKKLWFTGGKAYKIKVNEGFADAVQNLRKAGVSEDVIKNLDEGLLTADDIIPTLKPTIENYDEIVTEIRKIDSIREVMDAVIKGESEMLASKFLATHRLQDAFRAHQKLGRGKKGRAVLDLFEKAAIEKIDGTWGLGDDWYNALKAAGVGDDEIASIVIRNRGFSTSELISDNPMAGAVRETLDNMNKVPLAYEMDEFYAGLDAALKHIDPKLQPLLDQHRVIYKELGEELIKRDILTRETMDNFAKELGLSHLKHFPKQRYWQFIKNAGVAKRHSMMDDAHKAIRQMAGDLQRANIPKAEADKVLAAAKADIKKMMKAKRGAAETINEADLLKGLFDQAQAVHNTYPDIAMGTILKRFRGALKDVRGFRSVMGTVNEIDDLAVSAGFKKVIETNAAEIMFKHELQMRRAIAYNDYIERIIKNFPDAVQRWKPGMDDAGKVLVEDAFMGKYAVDEGFENTFKLILGMETGTGDVWNTYFKWFDWAQEKFRYYTLIPFFKFHSRNLFSEEYMNTLGGMNVLDPLWTKSHKKATRLAFDAIVKKDPAALETYAHIMKQGTLGHGWFGAELGMGQNLQRGSAPLPFMGREYAMPFSIRQSPVIGTKVLPAFERSGELIEAIPRLSMYYYGLEKGPGWVATQMSRSVKLTGKMDFPPPIKAATKEATEEMSQNLAKGLQRYKLPYAPPDGLVDYTRKFHPTYDRFTPLEQQVFRRAMPFYSWPRFNLPLHFEMLMRKPRAYAQIERSRRFVTRLRGAQLPDKDAPEYIKRGYAIGWSKTGPMQSYQIMRNWLAPVDVDDVIPIVKRGDKWAVSFKPIADKFQQMLTPIAKQPFETFITRKDSYTGRDLPSYPGAKAVLTGIPGTDKTIKIGERPYHLLKSIRVLQETNKFFWGEHDIFWDGIVGHLFGRMYSVDIDKARRYLYYGFMEQLHGRPGLNNQYDETGLLAGRRIAEKNKDWSTMKELDKRIKLIERELARLKPYVIKKKLKRGRDSRKRRKQR